MENVGSDRLYCLTVMVPNEGLAELIRAGAVMALDADDEAVVGGHALQDRAHPARS